MALQGQYEESDEQLLHTFIARHDDRAFAALVRRYGPLVFGVCRRVLHHAQDAEDAFQATFLLLARNAAALRNKTALGSWLHGVAYRVAQTAKRSAARRRKYEGSLGALTQPRSLADPADELSWREVRTMLDEEIARLPEIYRSVFVLCCLEDASREEAARRLGLKEGTISSRLTAARKRLSRRLALRGLELPAVLAVSTLVTLPAGLMAKTMKAVLANTSGNAPADMVPASVAELVQGATLAMMVSKTKSAAVVLLAMTLLSGAGVYFLASPQRQQGQPLLALRAAGGNADAPRSVKRDEAKTVGIRGRVLGPDGKPLKGARLYWPRLPKTEPLTEEEIEKIEIPQR
jgi:RNA polymerase sigma factor (sigma-70 family)